jgi:hypothetical protein
MTLNPIRGAKFGAGSAVCFAAVMPINNLIRHEETNWSTVLLGSIFVFFVFGLVRALTDKVGGDFGDS